MEGAVDPERILPCLRNVTPLGAFLYIQYARILVRTVLPLPGAVHLQVSQYTGPADVPHNVDSVLQERVAVPQKQAVEVPTRDHLHSCRTHMALPLLLGVMVLAPVAAATFA